MIKHGHRIAAEPLRQLSHAEFVRADLFHQRDGGGCHQGFVEPTGGHLGFGSGHYQLRGISQ